MQIVSDNVECGHSEDEMIRVVTAVLATPPEVQGAVVDCGCWKGGSTAKISLASALTARKLFVFDSFQGIPQNDEGFVQTIHGQSITFRAGDYQADIEEVRDNLRLYGNSSEVALTAGWFHETLSAFDEKVVLPYLDVDLVASTMTYIAYLWPRLMPGGALFFQDGHITDVIEALRNDVWWSQHFGISTPHLHGAGSTKLVYLTRPGDIR
jgi:O-methyltransferase